MTDMAAYLKKIEAGISAGPYADTWESLSTHPIPAWYRNAKLGFFIHWGLYSVPAYMNEWYPRLMYYKKNVVHHHHVKTYGKEFEYHDFIPMFKAEKFNAADWIAFFNDCGADFVMPVAEHHDGFKMYASEVSKWNAQEMGPKRDILGELRQACCDKGIKFAASNHRAEHYWFLNGGNTLNATNATHKEEYREFYGPRADHYKENSIRNLGACGANITPDQAWLEDWLVSSCEVVDKYCPSAFYFDFWTADEAFRPYMRKFLAYFYNTAAARGKEVVSFYKNDAALYPCGVYVQERGQKEGMSVEIWQCETSTSYNAWSYCTTNKFKASREIVCNMVDVWSKNGCMALNIGPKADGTLCAEEIAILKDMRDWIAKNKEAIWDTGVFRIHGEGKKQKHGAFQEKYKYGKADFRFTYKLGTLYAFALMPKGQTKFRIRSLSPKGASNAVVKAVSVLGETTKAAFKQTGAYLEITLEQPVQTEMPLCFKIILN